MAMSYRRIPITGWSKCVHGAAAFESEGEYAAALILDRAAAVEWWLRNDPPILRIPTPITYFEPDFLYLARRSEEAKYCVLEIKGEIFWDGPGSDPRVKSAAGCEWVKAVNETEPRIGWELTVVIDQDAIGAASLEGLLHDAVFRCPESQEAP
jgi:hypothetical protein